MFDLQAPFQPAGDQPQAIAELLAGINAGKKYQTLMGVTGSGKTFTMANVIQQLQRPKYVPFVEKIRLLFRQNQLKST